MNQARIYMKQFFLRKKRGNPRYSMRGLARILNYSPSYVSQIFQGKKKIPLNGTEKIGKALDMDSDAQAHFEALVHRDFLIERGVDLKLLPREESFSEYEAVEKRMAAVLSEWYHLAILDLSTCVHFRSEPTWIAAQLGIEEEQAEESIEKLVSLGLLKKRGKKLKKTVLKIRFPTNESTLALIRRYHQKMIEKGLDALYSTPKEEQDRRVISGITFASNPRQYKKARKRLNEALHEVANILSEGECTDVYQINAQLFPLTRTASAQKCK